MNVKEVLAVIRPEKMGLTREAVLACGAEEVVQRRVLGRGRQRGLRYLKPASDAGGEMLFLSKRMLVSWVRDDIALKVVDAIVRVNQTGNVGDGKVFVRPLVPSDSSTAAPSESLAPASV